MKVLQTGMVGGENDTDIVGPLCLLESIYIE